MFIVDVSSVKFRSLLVQISSGINVDDRFRIIDIEDRYECFEVTNPGIFEDGNTVKMLNSDGVDMYVWY